MSRSRTEHGARSLWRLMGAALLAMGLVLLAPASFAGAQTDDTLPEETDSSVPDESIPEDTVPEDTVPEDTSTTVPEDEAPEDEVPDEVPEDDGVVELQGENIRMVFTPDEEQGPCSPVPATALMNYVGGDDEEFRLRIIAQDPLCDALEVTAAIYGMPGNGEAWPQTLVETLDFTIKDAGEYLVSFTKTCDPVQFDVITGDTPEVIQPLGEWHGPLLFPFDTATSLQHWGCPEVAAETTLPPAEDVAPAQLALTGTTSTVAATAGAAILLAGAAMLLLARRRSV